MRLQSLELSLVLTALPFLSLAAYEPAAEESVEPTTTIYSTSTNTVTQTIIAASVTQTLTSTTSIASLSSLPSATVVSTPVASIPVSISSSAPSSPILPPSSAAPYPIPQSSFATLPSGTASPSGTGAVAGTGAPATPNPSIEPFQGAGSRVGGQWVGIAGALVVGFGFLAV